MQINNESLETLDQQAEDSLRHLNKLWHSSNGLLTTLQKQPWPQVLEEYERTLQELQLAVKELRQHNQELAATRQVLQKVQSNLEKQVEERTSELLQANQQLKQEIAKRQRAEKALWQQLATQMSIAIQQSELYQHVQQLNTDLERQVQERTEQLRQALNFEAMLKRITDDVRDSLDESQILQVAVWELAVALNLDGCNTALYNAEQTRAIINYDYTVDMPSIQGHVIRMADFPEGYTQLLQGQYFQFCEIVPGIRGRVAMLACPIFDGQGVLGDLWLFKQHLELFTELEIRLVQQVANQCAIAIRQARLYQAAQAQVEQQKKLNQLKDDFLSTVSHELRTPVSNMKMAIQMLGITLNREQGLFAELTKPQPEQGRVARYFQILQNECEREISLINNLLDLQRLYAGVEALVLTSILLQEWLPSLIEPFVEKVQSRQQILQINISPHLPRLICDCASLARVVIELLDNACKYTPPGEKIVVTAQMGETYPQVIELSVSNSGVEISPDELPRVFEKFYRIPSNDPWKQGGTGLGLALVQQLMTHLGGSIHVESAARQTSFILRLPLNQEQRIKL